MISQTPQNTSNTIASFSVHCSFYFPIFVSYTSENSVSKPPKALARSACGYYQSTTDTNTIDYLTKEITMELSKLMENLHQKFLSKKTKDKSEQFILWIALVSFIIHLVLIGLIHFNLISISEPANLLKNPIAAIYTPFSFILVYEVYLLIYYLPKSTSTYISKQYEIIALIIIRRLFKDLSDLSLSSNWFSIKNDLQFTYDLVASVLLFYLIYLFHIQRTKVYRTSKNSEDHNRSISKFINAKKWVATALVPILVGIAIYSFLNWSIGVIQPVETNSISFKNINNIFFEQFFNILIIADVILLLFSFFHTDEFHKVIRNSGFILSTILIRISFSVSGVINTIMIVSAILFGLLIFFIHNKFEKHLAEETEEQKN